MKTEKELIKEYLELKAKYNRKVTYVNKMIDNRKKNYRDSHRYEKAKMVLYQMELAIKRKAKELKEIL